MASGPEDIFKRTQQVGLLDPAKFELRDMAGNVAEWTACAASDPSCSVIGGHFRNYDEQYFRVAFEDTGIPRDTRRDVVGFRCAAPAYSETSRP